MISSVNNTMISGSIREDLRTARLAVLAALKQREYRTAVTGVLIMNELLSIDTRGQIPDLKKELSPEDEEALKSWIHNNLDKIDIAAVNSIIKPLLQC
jgi:hypothetical protein